MMGIRTGGLSSSTSSSGPMSFTSCAAAPESGAPGNGRQPVAGPSVPRVLWRCAEPEEYAIVPPQARIRTLGTEFFFTASNVARECAVFRGRVEMTPIGGSSVVAQAPFRLKTGWQDEALRGAGRKKVPAGLPGLRRLRSDAGLAEILRLQNDGGQTAPVGTPVAQSTPAADTVVLESGAQIVGQLLVQDRVRVVVRTSEGIRILAKSHVRSIVLGK